MRRASSRFLQFAPLAGCVSLLLAPAITAHAGNPPVSASAANTTGMTIAVTNCNDHGIGSLRNAINRALSGDTVDMKGLACRRINLTSGAIMIPQDNLTLVGGGHITADANRLSSVFRHSGTGLLRIRGMTIARGSGGCIRSAGHLALKNTLVHWCSGGGIFAPQGGVTLEYSRVLGNTGGGIYARGHLRIHGSYVCGNHGGGALALGGLTVSYSVISNNAGYALNAYGSGTISYSTISGNKSLQQYQSVVDLNVLEQPGLDEAFSITDSTISGNTSGSQTLFMGHGYKQISNTTIAFNRHYSTDTSSCSMEDGRGTVLISLTEVGRGGLDEDPPGPAFIDSTIIANNSCDGEPYADLAAYYPDDYDMSGMPIVFGANNLITSSHVPLPPDTISVDPRLAPLAKNGGRTKTHALLADSPAIDAGNNAFGFLYDQRGSGFPRVKGLQADIGAYER